MGLIVIPARIALLFHDRRVHQGDDDGRGQLPLRLSGRRDAAAEAVPDVCGLPHRFYVLRGQQQQPRRLSGRNERSMQRWRVMCALFS